MAAAMALLSKEAKGEITGRRATFDVTNHPALASLPVVGKLMVKPQVSSSGDASQPAQAASHPAASSPTIATGTPALAEIPVLGRLFNNRQDAQRDPSDVRKADVRLPLIFITPRVAPDTSGEI